MKNLVLANGQYGWVVGFNFFKKTFLVRLYNGGFINVKEHSIRMPSISFSEEIQQEEMYG